MLIQSVMHTPKCYRRSNVRSDNSFKKLKSTYYIILHYGKRIHAFNCPKLKKTILTLDQITVVCMYV